MTLATHALIRQAAEVAATNGEPFACLVSARGHADLGRQSLLARDLTLEWSTSVGAADAAATSAALRSAAQAAFARGARGLLVLVAHEAASCFDRIAVHDDWCGLPKIQLWSAATVLRAPGGQAAGCWGDPQRDERLFPRDSLASPALQAWHTQAVARIHEAIAAGRLYQLCLTFPVRFAPPKDYASLFAALVARHPVDHAAWVNLPDFRLLSASPERFLAVRAREVTQRPMKGTRRLNVFAPEDPSSKNADALTRHELAIERVMQELASSSKDRAENVMITDLVRNDLGRVCRPGSVRVDSLFEVERYASVAQMTSTVRGELRAGLDVWDALAAAFPPGSMTGAPKIESCEMIRELEQGPRGLYGGVLGWVEPGGDAEFSVVIRSLQSRGSEARWDIGGGIVHDSRADAEWDEAWAKFAALRPLVNVPDAG